MSAGRLIVVEGLDGTGKTTLSRGLEQALGATWFTTPDAGLRTLRGHIEQELACPDAIQLFYAASVLAVSARAVSLLAAGQDVVIDRYWLSTWACGPTRPSSLELDEVEARLVPATCTLLLTTGSDERRLRLEKRARGCTANDRASLLPEVEASMQARFHQGMLRPVAGLARELDNTHLSEQETLRAALCLLSASTMSDRAA